MRRSALRIASRSNVLAPPTGIGRKSEGGEHGVNVHGTHGESAFRGGRVTLPKPALWQGHTAKAAASLPSPASSALARMRRRPS